MPSNKIGALPVVDRGKLAETLGPEDGSIGMAWSEETRMKVKDVKTKDPLTTDLEAPLATAVDVMRTNELRHLPVVNNATCPHD